MSFIFNNLHIIYLLMFVALHHFFYDGLTPIIFIYLINLKKIRMKNFNIKNIC